MDEKYRHCTRKKKFLSERDAIPSSGGSAYRCRYCGYWHGTKRPRRDAGGRLAYTPAVARNRVEEPWTRGK